VRLGLRGVFNCEQCDDLTKIERGHCPFVKDATDAPEPIYIDTTGIEEHDAIRCCPRGIQIREPFAQQDIERFHKIERLGGASAWFPPPLSMQDHLTTETYTLLDAIQVRFVAEVKKQRIEMDRGAP
jgi:hypothetical protein